MNKILENKRSGFTLIEIILALVIAAVVGTGLAQYLGTAFTTSAIPIQHLRQAFKLQQVMENITEDYENGSTALYSSDEGEDTLHTRIGNLVHGNGIEGFVYIVDTNDFGPIEIGGQDVLKVTIVNESGGGRITTLFTSQ